MAALQGTHGQLFVASALLAFSCPAAAHSGGLNAEGCYNNRKTGESTTATAHRRRFTRHAALGRPSLRRAAPRRWALHPATVLLLVEHSATAPKRAPQALHRFGEVTRGTGLTWIVTAMAWAANEHGRER
jgi:hypothetical protein